MGAHHHHHHGHGHDHGHSHAHGGSDARRLGLALVIIAGFAVVEIVGGFLSGSLALLADAGHMVTDAAALLLALVAKRLSSRPPTARFPFGTARAKVLAAFLNGLGLFVLIGILLHESWDRFQSPQDISAGLMLTVAIVGLLANIGAFFVLHGGESEDVNMRGAVLHVIGDMLGSVAAIISALVIMATGWLAVDPLVTVIVCLLIGRSAWHLIKETTLVLLQGAPSGGLSAAITARVPAGVSGIIDVHDVRVWMLTPDEFQATLHVRIGEAEDADETLRAVKTLLHDEFSIERSTVQVEVCPDHVKADTALHVCCPDRATAPADENALA